MNSNRVVEVCVAGSSLDAHEAALRAMEYLQAGARRSSDEMIAAFEHLEAHQRPETRAAGVR